MKLCFPERILEQHAAWLGKTGAGKSSALRQNLKSSRATWRGSFNCKICRSASERKAWRAAKKGVRIAKLTSGNSGVEPTVNERCILNICEQITREL
jgi:hypothetical protein